MPGVYATQGAGHGMQGGLYVERWEGEVTQPLPVVMVHGGGQTGICYTSKPDGGEGWAQAFARSGYSVYVIDEIARGRSPYGCDLDGPLRPAVVVEMVERMFTASAAFNLWPSAA